MKYLDLYKKILNFSTSQGLKGPVATLKDFQRT